MKNLKTLSLLTLFLLIISCYNKDEIYSVIGPGGSGGNTNPDPDIGTNILKNLDEYIEIETQFPGGSESDIESIITESEYDTYYHLVNQTLTTEIMNPLTGILEEEISSAQITYNGDLLTNLSFISQGFPENTAIEYDSDDNITKITYTLDQNNYIISLNHESPDLITAVTTLGAQELNTAVYSLQNDRLTQVVVTFPNSTNSYTEMYTYSNENLISYQVSSANLNETITYEYDNKNNPLKDLYQNYGGTFGGIPFISIGTFSDMATAENLYYENANFIANISKNNVLNWAYKDTYNDIVMSTFTYEYNADNNPINRYREEERSLLVGNGTITVTTSFDIDYTYF